jgi:hypothetical protein
LHLSWAIYQETPFLAMAAVDMRHVNFWLPPDFYPDTQHTTSQKHGRGSAAAANLRDQGLSQYKKAESRLQSSSKSKPKSGVVTQQHGFQIHCEDDNFNPQGTCEAEHFLEDPI